MFYIFQLEKSWAPHKTPSEWDALTGDDKVAGILPDAEEILIFNQRHGWWTLDWVRPTGSRELFRDYNLFTDTAQQNIAQRGDEEDR